jgi:hypothetical protein
MSATYGYSDDLDEDRIENEHWAFIIKLNHYMLYVKEDKELSWFKMKYGQEVK